MDKVAAPSLVSVPRARCCRERGARWPILFRKQAWQLPMPWPFGHQRSLSFQKPWRVPCPHPREQGRISAPAQAIEACCERGFWRHLCRSHTLTRHGACVFSFFAVSSLSLGRSRNDSSSDERRCRAATWNPLFDQWTHVQGWQRGCLSVLVQGWRRE